MRLKDKIYAIQLRKECKTHGEIREIIPNLSKSTLSGWLRDVKLTPTQEERIRKKAVERIDNARFFAAKTNKANRLKRMEKTIKDAKEEVPKLLCSRLFLIGLILYWCEGTQKTGDFSFMNSDPVIIKIMMKWLQNVCKIPKNKVRFRLYIHRVYAKERCERFWSKELGVPLSQIKVTYKPTPHKFKRNPGYKGCLKVDAGGVELFRKFVGWRDGLVELLEI